MDAGDLADELGREQNADPGLGKQLRPAGRNVAGGVVRFETSRVVKAVANETRFLPGAGTADGFEDACANVKAWVR